MFLARQLRRCVSVPDVRLLAKRRLPSPIFEYLDGGSEEEYTLRRNTRAFDEVKLSPRCLVDVRNVSTATTVLGARLEWPVFCSPTGASRFYHSEGELAVARAAARSGTLYSLSTMSSYSLENVAAASAGPKMFQLYIFRDRGITRDLIARCRAAGYTALCLTVDTAVRGNRERELRSGMGAPMRLTPASMLSIAMSPHWLMGLAAKGPLSMPNFAKSAKSSRMAEQTRFVATQLDPSVTWKDVGEIIKLWGGPFAIKGILSPDDAVHAADLGATAVIVSNHGGRQLDGAVSPIEVLPQIVEAVGDRVEIILDGGVRRGVHVLKAMALGAKACSVGRPYLYGLGAGGEAGVTRALQLLRSEFVRSMQLAGCTDVHGIARSLVTKI